MVSWKAADQGEAHAQFMLGAMYNEGIGVPQDYVQAYMWLNLSAAGGDEVAHQSRDLLLAPKMSREQIAQAQELTRKWQPKMASAAVPTNHSSNAATAPPQLDAAGTGFFVTGQGHIVTNHHVVDGCAALKIQNGPPLTVIAHDDGNDLALLKSALLAPAFATFSTNPGRVGQPVMAVGFPLRGLVSSGVNVTTGNVSALAGANDDTGMLQMTAPVQPGNSGGPLLDQSGNVIGVVVAKLDALKIARATGDIPHKM